MEELRKVNLKKLLDYGFERADKGFVYSKDIVDGEFNLTVFVSKAGAVETKVEDKTTQEEFVLYRVKSSGAFASQVRAECDKILADIYDKCYEKEVFKTPQSKALIRHVEKCYGDQLEFLWKSFPQDAIWRRKDNEKWYGLLMVVPKSKFGAFSEEKVEVLNVRIASEKIASVLDGKNIFEAYHMNKKRWLSIVLDGGQEDKKVFEMLKDSYALAGIKK